MQLSPNSVIPVSYTVSLPGDTTVYFVQAVLRDTQSGATLQTLNLANVSTTPNRYQGVFNPVSDPSGLGRAIDITISVYTDAGHTTLSLNYQVLQLNYVILQPWIQNLGMGGGMNIDYEKLQSMFDGAKVGNEEIGNEVARRIPRTKVDYGKIENYTITASEKTKTSLSSEIGKHMGILSKTLSDIKSNVALQSHIKSLEARIQSLESKSLRGQDISFRIHSELKNELSSALSEFRQGQAKSYFSNMSNDHVNNERIKNAISDLSDYIHRHLKQANPSVGVETPKKKEKRGNLGKHVASLIGTSYKNSDDDEASPFAPEHLRALLT